MQRILIVDDDILVLKAISKLLSVKGFFVKEARSGEEAIRFLTNESFDLVISDIRMAGLDGIQVVERLRGMGKTTPVILVTGYASEDAPIEAFRLGVSGYILKPFDAEDLLAKVAKSLNVTRASNDNVYALFFELKRIVEKFENENGAKIFEVSGLREFLKKINSVIFLVEKSRVESDV